MRPVRFARLHSRCVRFGVWSLLLPVILSCACQEWFKPLALVLPPPKRKVPAEFAHLQGSVAVLVWVRPETHYDYPYARLEVASHVADQLLAHVRPRITCADVPAVEDYLDRSSGRFVDPEQVGRELDTRFVIYLELLEFSLRDAYVPDFLQGHIRSSVTVYDLSDKDLSPRAYELAPVDTRVPQRPVRFTQANAAMIRRATYETFAGMVAKKFYAHQEVVE